MRPIYENSETKAIERKIADVVCKAFGVEMVKLPMSYQIDFVVLRDGVIKSVLEVKQRDINLTTYPTIILSMHKYMFGKKLNEEMGVPFIFVIGLKNGIFWVDLSDKKYPVALGGRTDRGDDQDVELVIQIPTSDFKEIVAAI